MSGYFEIATCPICHKRVDATTPNYKFVIVEGTVCRICDKRPSQKPSSAARLILVHENHVDKFVRRVAAKTWTP